MSVPYQNFDPTNNSQPIYLPPSTINSPFAHSAQPNVNQQPYSYPPQQQMYQVPSQYNQIPMGIPQPHYSQQVYPQYEPGMPVILPNADVNSPAYKQARIQQIEHTLTNYFTCYSVWLWIALILNILGLLSFILLASIDTSEMDLEIDPEEEADLEMMVGFGIVVCAVAIFGYINGILGFRKRSSKKTKTFQYYLIFEVVANLIFLLMGHILGAIISFGIIYLLYITAEKCFQLCKEREELISRPN